MRAPTTLLFTLLALTLHASGCAAPAQPATTDEPSSGQDSAAPPVDASGGGGSSADTAVPEGAKVVCNLDCSGNQAKGYGVDEAEARADVSKNVEKLCKPEDGQYFIFCEPIT